MSELHPVLLDSFNDELEKLSAPLNLLPNLARRALSGGSAAALGGAGGAALGAGAGAVHGAVKAKREGGSAGWGALSGGLRGAALGGSLGAGAGLAGGAVAGKRGAELARQLAERKGVVGGISRFGQRQAHAVTGALPEGFKTRSAAIRSIGGGGAPVAEQLKGVKTQLRSKGLDAAKKEKLLANQERLQKAMAGATAAEETGMTSIPGMFRALAKPSEFKRGIVGATQQQWHSAGGPVGKGLMVGFPGVFMASEAMRESKPGERGRVARTLGAGLESIPYSVLPMGLVGSSLVGAGTGAAGRAVGGLLPGQGRRLRPAAPEPEESEEGMGAPVERVVSPQAQGRAPEGMMG
jgi:hypothetical protein